MNTKIMNFLHGQDTAENFYKSLSEIRSNLIREGEAEWKTWEHRQQAEAAHRLYDEFF